jgi:phosphatidylglycerophosphate synthase
MNLPNALTVARMFLVPLLVVVLLTEFEGRHILGVPKELVGGWTAIWRGDGGR